MSRGRIAFGASALAVVFGAVLFSAAFWAPLYSEARSGIAGTTQATLVDVNGYRVLIPVAIPLVLALIAFVGLWARCTRGSNVGNIAAIVVLTILGCFTLLGAMTIGIFVLPITALVATAVAITPDGIRP